MRTMVKIPLFNLYFRENNKIEEMKNINEILNQNEYSLKYLLVFLDRLENSRQLSKRKQLSYMQ